MVTIALLGADGAGKTTIGRRLEEDAKLRIKYIYMGINPDAVNRVLPTTWLWMKVKKTIGMASDQGGPPDPTRQERPKSRWKRLLRGAKSNVRLANQLAEEWYRQTLAWYYQCRGFVVLFDRHFFADYFAHHVQTNGQRPLGKRLHGAILNRLYPRPDLVIVLDAPAEVLFARKGEGTIALIEKRRREYLEIENHVPRFSVVDATFPLDEVTREVVKLIEDVRGRRS
jgi:thymidylate kinase